MTIDSFRGKYSFLSNFHPSRIQYAGYEYPTAEHAYQASKTGYPDQEEKIRNAETPAQAKHLGQKVTLRPKWDYIKDNVMYNILLSKFSQNEYLKDKILSTGDEILIEGNTWGDKYWGVCNGEGYNVLGILLMRVRNFLKDENKSSTL